MISSEGLQTVKNTVQQVKVGAVRRVGCGFLDVQEVFGDEITDEDSCDLQVNLAVGRDLGNRLRVGAEFEDRSSFHAGALDGRLPLGGEANLRFDGEFD